MKNTHTSFFRKAAGLLAALLMMVSTAYATDYYVSPGGNDANSGLFGFPKKTIQAAINAASAGDGIKVAAGTYNEDVLINKQLTLLGAGYASTTVSGPIGGGGATMQVSAAGVIIDGFTVTRDGNNTTDWNNPGLNLVGIAVQGLTSYVEVRNSNLVGNRTGIDINNSNGNNIHNNIIDDNRTGILFRNQTNNTNLQQNFITNNWTVGVLFLDASSGTNSPVQQALNSAFNNNNISGNWYGDVVDRQSGGALPAPGTTNMKNFECNWYGSASAPSTSTSNSTEPGYSGQIPVAYGGTATAPGGQPNILGQASANIDYTPWMTNGTDDNAAAGFQPVPNSCSGCPSGNVVQNTRTMQFYCSIQAAINDPLTLNGDIITASAGTYNENVDITKSITLKGANYNVSCSGGRGAESIINGTGASGTTAVFISANGVTVNGFKVTNANGSFGIQIRGKSNVDIQYNIVTNVGNAVSGSRPTFGIYDQMPQAIGNNAMNVNVANNCVNAIRGGQNTALTGTAARLNNGSGSGIGFGDSQTQSDLAGVTINGNVIDNITASTNAFADGGKGAYGVIINIGANATAVGKTISPQVTNNSITNLEGFWAHGVGLEGETPGAKVFNNYINAIIDHKGGDASGVRIEANDGAASVQIHDNSFTNVTWGVDNAMTSLTVDATCNWYGDPYYAVVSTKINGNVNYTPWLVNGTDNEPATPGFQPVPGSCTEIRCGNNNEKILVAHISNNGCHVICVSKNAVAAHLAHGDNLGNCPPARSALGIEEHTETTISVYPNPSSGVFIIELTGVKEEAAITITDIQGKVVGSQTLQAGEAPVASFDLSTLSAGVYFIQVRDADIHYQSKLILK